jgi:shikimate kinase
MLGEKDIQKPIVLVGLMGAGKTSVGKMLAKRLSMPFEDSDTEVVKAAGCSVVDIFQLYGEEEFRRVEAGVIRRLLSGGEVKVISTGEGAFTIESVRRLLREKAISVWLKADLDLLVKRTSFKSTRPLLLSYSPREILKRLMDERYPIYATADITVETKDEATGITLDKALGAIEKFIKDGGEK